MPQGGAIFKALEPLAVLAIIGAVLIWQWLSIRAEIARDRERARLAQESTKPPEIDAD